MLQSMRNKATVSIMDRLKQKGMPASGLSPAGEFQEEPDYTQLDANGQVIQEPGITPEDLSQQPALPQKPLLKKKPLPVPSSGGGSY